MAGLMGNIFPGSKKARKNPMPTLKGNPALRSSPQLLAISNRIIVLYRGRVAGVVEGDTMTQRNVLHLAVRGIENERREGPNQEITPEAIQ